MTLNISAYFDVCHCSLAEGVLLTYITAHVIHKDNWCCCDNTNIWKHISWNRWKVKIVLIISVGLWLIIVILGIISLHCVLYEIMSCNKVFWISTVNTIVTNDLCFSGAWLVILLFKSIFGAVGRKEFFLLHNIFWNFHFVHVCTKNGNLGQQHCMYILFWISRDLISSGA